MPDTQAEWPQVHWLSPKKLSIRVPGRADIVVPLAHVPDIQTELSFCPADPADRSRWLAYKAARHQWIKDTTAWTELKKRDPTIPAPKPTQPKPPAGAETIPVCAPEVNCEGIGLYDEHDSRQVAHCRPPESSTLLRSRYGFNLLACRVTPTGSQITVGSTAQFCSNCAISLARRS